VAAATSATPNDDIKAPRRYPEGVPKEKKPDVPAVREKLHGAGAHSRESKTPKAKQKAVYGKPKN